jgi:hypothetical protein
VLDIGPSTVVSCTGDFSLAAWIRTSTSTGNPIIIDKRQEDSGPVVGYALALWDGSPLFQIADGTHATFVSSAFVADGQWHHVAVTVDRDQPDGIHFYVDGLPVDAGMNPTGHLGSLANNLPLRIGRRSDSSNGAYFTGNIDEVTVSGTAWCAETVLAIYNGANSLPGTSMGTTSSSPCCPSMSLSSYGGLPKIGNLSFGLQVENAPVPGTALLFLHAGAPLSLPGSTVGLLGTWVMPPTVPGIDFGSGPFPTTGVPSCGGTVQFPLPLPMSIPSAAVGIVVSAQAFVNCSAGLGLTNGWQFTLQPM